MSSDVYLVTRLRLPGHGSGVVTWCDLGAQLSLYFWSVYLDGRGIQFSQPTNYTGVTPFHLPFRSSVLRTQIKIETVDDGCPVLHEEITGKFPTKGLLWSG